MKRRLKKIEKSHFNEPVNFSSAKRFKASAPKRQLKIFETPFINHYLTV
jgi:hypothetical protein